MRPIVTGLAVWALATPAGAVNLHAHAEAQGAAHVAPDFSSVDGGELQATVSAFGVGLGVGGVYERLGGLDAVSALGLFQLRPNAWLGMIHNRFVYPHLETGVGVGALFDTAVESRFDYWLGGGVDVRLTPGNRFLLLNIAWRYAPVRSPSSAPANTLLLGLGFRLNDE